METIYEFSAYHGVFLSLVILVSKYGKSTANQLISLAVLFFSFTLFEWISYDDLIPKYPHLTLFSNPFLYAIAPLIWLYVLSYTRWKEKIPVKFKMIALMPSLAYLAGTYRFYLLSGQDKIDMLFNDKLDLVFYGPKEIYPIGYLLITIIFMLITFKEFKRSGVKDNIGASRLKWLKVITTAYLIFACVGFAGWVFNHYVFVSQVVYHITLVFQVVAIQGSGYMAIIKPAIFSSVDKEEGTMKYEKSSLDKTRSEALAQELQELLIRRKLYLNMDLNPQDIALELGISKHHLSQVLSQQLKKTFNELINQYRVETAMEMIASENDTPYKLIHLAFDSGFNNKTTFLRNFKKYTGLTPSLYRDKLKNDRTA